MITFTKRRKERWFIPVGANKKSKKDSLLFDTDDQFSSWFCWKFSWFVNGSKLSLFGGETMGHFIIKWMIWLNFKNCRLLIDRFIWTRVLFFFFFRSWWAFCIHVIGCSCFIFLSTRRCASPLESFDEGLHVGFKIQTQPNPNLIKPNPVSLLWSGWTMWVWVRPT